MDVFQLTNPTRLMIALEILWRVPTTLGVHPEQDFGQVRGALPGLDWGSSTESSLPRGLDWGVRFGSLRCTNSIGLPPGSDALFRFCFAVFIGGARGAGVCGGIHSPPATDFVGGRSPNVEGDHWSSVAGKVVVTQTHRRTTPHSLDLFGVDLDRG